MNRVLFPILALTLSACTPAAGPVPALPSASAAASAAPSAAPSAAASAAASAAPSADPSALPSTAASAAVPGVAPSAKAPAFTDAEIDAAYVEYDAYLAAAGAPLRVDPKPVTVTRAAATRISGLVTFYNEGRGYGFIKADSGETYFVAKPDTMHNIREGLRVEFSVRTEKRGQLAVDVTIQ